MHAAGMSFRAPVRLKVVFGCTQWEFMTGSMASKQCQLALLAGRGDRLTFTLDGTASAASPRPCPVFDSSSGSKQLVLNFSADTDAAAPSSIAPSSVPIRRSAPRAEGKQVLPRALAASRQQLKKKLAATDLFDLRFKYHSACCDRWEGADGGWRHHTGPHQRVA